MSDIHLEWMTRRYGPARAGQLKQTIV